MLNYCQNGLVNPAPNFTHPLPAAWFARDHSLVTSILVSLQPPLPFESNPLGYLNVGI